MTTTIVDRTKHADHELNSIHYREARRRLVESGWLFLGEGFYGSAWEHPDCPGTVLKVGRLDGPAENDGWLNYVKTLAGEGMAERSPHAPKVAALEIYKGHYYAEVERLETLPQHDYDRHHLSRTGNVSIMDDGTLKDHVRWCEDTRQTRFPDHDRDYHAGNYMRRPATGEIVLTDPWA